MLDCLQVGSFFACQSQKKSQNFTFFLLTLAALVWYFYIMGWLQKYYFGTDSHYKINITEITRKSKKLDPKNHFFLIQFCSHS